MKTKHLLLFLLPLFLCGCLSLGEGRLQENRDGELVYQVQVLGENSAALVSELSQTFPSPKNGSCVFDYVDGQLQNQKGTASTLFPDDVFKGGAEDVQSIQAVLNAKYGEGKAPIYTTVFTNGKEGYDVYRIPSVVTISPNRLVLFAEARGTGRTDCVENKIVCKISTDGGKSFGPLILIADSGEASLNNPVPVYLPEEDKLIVIFQQYPAKGNETTTDSNKDSPNICRTFISTSFDQGKTWSPKNDVTWQFKKEGMSAVACGPAQAIVLKYGPFKGRIVVPCASTGLDAGWYNYLVYSDDNGTSWQLSNNHSAYGTNESSVAQIGENELLVSARNHRFEGDEFEAPIGWNPWNTAKTSKFRAFYRVTMTKEGFEWSEPIIKDQIPDPRCQGSILSDSKESQILYLSNSSNFYHIKAFDSGRRSPHPTRINGCIRMSQNGGKSWGAPRRIYGNRWTGFQYSVLTEINKDTLGCVFEALPEIKFVAIDKRWLSNN